MATRGDECEPRELLKVLLYVEAGEESWDANDSTSSMERDSHPFWTLTMAYANCVLS